MFTFESLSLDVPVAAAAAVDVAASFVVDCFPPFILFTIFELEPTSSLDSNNQNQETKFNKQLDRFRLIRLLTEIRKCIVANSFDARVFERPFGPDTRSTQHKYSRHRSLIDHATRRRRCLLELGPWRGCNSIIVGYVEMRGRVDLSNGHGSCCGSGRITSFVVVTCRRRCRLVRVSQI